MALFDDHPPMFRRAPPVQIGRWGKFDYRWTQELVQQLSGLATKLEIQSQDSHDRRTMDFMYPRLDRAFDLYCKLDMVKSYWRHLIDPAQSRYLGYINPAARWPWLDIVLRGLEPVLRCHSDNLFLGTLQVAAWRTNDRDWHSDLDQIKKQIGGYLAGVSYVGQIDFALMTNWPADSFTRLKVVLPHFHFVAFGADAADRLANIAKIVPEPLPNQPGLEWEQITETPLQAVSYIFKAQTYGYRRIRDRTGRLLPIPDRLNFIQLFNRTTALSQVTYPDLAAGGGAGKRIVASAKRAAYALRKEGTQRDGLGRHE